VEYPKVSIVIPIVRPEKAKRCIHLIREDCGVPESTYEIIARVDEQEVGCPKMVKRLVGKAKFDLVCFLGDDTVPQKGWLKEALDVYNALSSGGNPYLGLIGLNDTINDGSEFSTHWIAHKDMLEWLPNGEFFYTGYNHMYVDYELCDLAKEKGLYAFARDAVVKHDHPAFKSGRGLDEHYLRVYSKDLYQHDQKLFWTRKRKRVIENVGFLPAISQPNVGAYIHTPYHISFTEMRKPRQDWIYLTPSKATTDFPTDWAKIRNDLAIQALNSGVTHHFMFDTDHQLPVDALSKLVTNKVWKDTHTGAVGGLCFRRYPPYDPIAMIGEPGKYRRLKDEVIDTDDTVEVDATGCACLAVSTQVYIDMLTIYPWYKEVIIEPEEGVEEYVGEDINFCWKMRQLGYKIHLDLSIDAVHLTLAGVGKNNYKLWQEMSKRGEGINMKGD
jgi:GT2 family glycosyltransferase